MSGEAAQAGEARRAAEGSGALAVASRFAGNSLVLLLSHGFNTVLAAVVAVLLVRYLGRTEYGILTTVYAYVSFFQIFTSLGMDTVLQREVARAPERAGEIVGQAVGARMLLAVSSMVVSWALLPAIQPSLRVAGLAVLLTLTFPFSFYPYYLVTYAVQLRQGLPKLVMGVWSLVVVGAKLGLMAAGAPLEAFVALEVVSAAVVFGLARRLGRYAGLRFRIERAPARWRAFLRESWPVALALTLIQVYLRIDQLMLYRMVGPAEVGLYGATVRVAEFANVIPTVFMASAFPIFSRLWVESEGRLREATSLSFRAMWVLSMPLAGVLFLYAEPFVTLLFGEEFRAAARMMALLAWSLPAAFVNSVLYNRLFSSGDQGTAAVLAAFAALLNVGLNLLLIPGYGGVGAAAATVVSYGVVPVAALVPAASRSAGAAALRCMLRPATAAAAGLGAVAGVGFGPVAGGAIYVGVYGAVLVAAGEVRAREVAVLRMAVGRGR